MGKFLLFRSINSLEKTQGQALLQQDDQEHRRRHPVAVVHEFGQGVLNKSKWFMENHHVIMFQQPPMFWMLGRFWDWDSLILIKTNWRGKSITSDKPLRSSWDWQNTVMCLVVTMYIVYIIIVYIYIYICLTNIYVERFTCIQTGH